MPNNFILLLQISASPQDSKNCYDGNINDNKINNNDN